MSKVLGGRLSPDEMFPAGRAGYDVRWLTLPDGTRLRAVYCAPAPDTALDAPPVLFVHGWACSMYTWNGNLRAAADAGLRTYAYDLVGHGRSDKPLDLARYTVPALAEQLREVLDALGLDRVLLVAHSMGAAIALRVAIDTPERVAGLVLAAPVGFGAISDIKLLHWLTPPPVDAILPYLVPRWTFRVALWRAYGRIGHATPQDVDEYWAPTRDPAFVRVLCRLAHAFDWTDGKAEELARVRCPTTILFGERDHLVRSHACEPYVQCLPQVHWEVIPRAGHTLPEEVPDRVNAAVLDAARALGRVEAATAGAASATMG